MMKNKKSNRWFFKIISLLVIFAFIGTQILPPGFADVVSLESQIQKQVPEKPVADGVSEEINGAVIPQNSIDFLGQDSPLSPPTSEVSPFRGTGNLGDINVQDLEPLPDSNVMEPSSLSEEGELVQQVIDPELLETPSNDFSSETPIMFENNLFSPPEMTPVGDPVDSAEENIYPGLGDNVLYGTVTQAAENQNEEKPKDRRDRTHYDYERYSFEEALDLLRPEYASAVIVKDLKEEDLRALLKLDFEVAIIVLSGEIVLFTTGNEEEIGITQAAQSLLKQASFISHTHVTEPSQSGPSSFDLAYAVEDPLEEYVLTQNGVYAYNQSGLQNNGEAYTLEEYLHLLNQAQDSSQEKDQMRARGLLNAFIHQMDLYNENERIKRETFRQAGETTIASFTDDFNRTSLGSDWTKIGGNFGISGNALVAFNSYPVYAGGVLFNKDLASNDYDLSIKFYAPDGGSITQKGFLARYQDANNYYYIKFNRWGNASIVKNQNGVLTTLTSGNLGWPTQNAWNAVRVEVVSDTFKVYLNGNLKLQAQDANNPITTGKVGIYTDVYGESFDDFSVTTIGSVPDTTPPGIPIVTDSGFYVTATNNIRASWMSSDPESGIVEYQYLLREGSLEGPIINPWTSTGTMTSTKLSLRVGLLLKNGRTYYFQVRARNEAGLWSEIGSSDGIMLEKTTAVMGQITDDGIATSSTSELHATWTPATDPESGVTKYEYLIRQDSTSGPVIVNYTSVGLATEVTKTGLNLISGKTYYIGVRAHNGAGLYSPPTYSNGIIVDTVAPTGTIAINNGADYANSPNVTLNLTAADATSGVDQMRISVDGGQNWMIDWTDFSANPQVALQEPDGLKTVVVQLKDKAGNISSEIISDMITLDTKKPEINVLSPNATNDPNYTLVYDVDGRRVEEPQVLTEGENPLTISETDPAGNTTTLNYVVTYTPPQADGPVVLADGTTLFYQGGVLIREQTLQGDEVFYRTDGSTERYRYADGRELHYSQDVPTVIKIYDTLGALIELVDQPTPTPLDEANALKLTLEGGVEAYYMNGNLVELRTQTGIRIADFTLTAANDIEHALLVYPDGTREIIRSGVLIRRIFSDGSIMDFTPNGFAVREVLSDAIQYYQFDKLSQTEVRNTKVFTSSNASSTYDELGILREVKGSSSERFFYLRNQTTDGFVTTLDRNVSSAPQAKSLIEAHYTVQGDLTEMKFEDGTRILLSQGKITQALDAVGNPIDYSYLEEAGLLTGLRVSRSGTQFDYDALGFLETITTSGGTIHRTWQDTDGNGVLSDQDVVDILLETVGGDRLSDFELDANGNIIRGIIETKEGIKQTIENGVLTGFETVDGKIYDFQNNEAILREWRFKDGMRVLYGGGNITEILFPDQSRLHTIGFNAKKEIESFVEELPDGTKKFFENGKLVKLITPEGTEIHYDPSGLAQRIILPDLSEETVSYVRDSLGQITEITFKGQTTYRTFKPDGTLVRLLTDGVNAEVTNGNISRLFTRFGELMQPTFTQGGILSGEVSLVNGTKLIITNGELVQAVRASGTKVNYASGRIESIETQAERYRLIYGSGNDIRIRLESEQGSPEFPLIPFLQNPDALMASVQGTSIPSYPVTFYDNAQIDTTQSQFGGASARFDGSGDYLSLPDSDDWDFGTGDFTIDFWVMFNSTGGEIALVSRNVDGILIRKSSAGKLQAYVNGNDVGDGTGDWNPSTGQWYHVAVVRAGTTGKTFVDGIQIGGDSTNSVDVQGTTGIRIGMRTDDVGPLNGWMDELRISKGTAWYTTNFPLPTSEYPSDTNTKLLLHFDPPNQEPSQLSQEGSELIKILFSRPLYDALSDPARVQSGLDIGQDIFFAKIFEDVVRGRAYEFGSSFFPEWLGVSVNQSNLDQGYLGRNVVLDALGNLPQLTSTLIDINGDGLLDRVFVPESGNYWWIQLNSGSGFDQPIPWQGVDRSYDSLSPTTLGSIDFYKGTHTYQLGRLMDMNGDGLPDRILQKSDGSRDWYIQINSGSGFDPTILWASNTHPYVEPSNLATYASEVRSDEAAKDVQELVVDLIDLDGDGLPDRLLRPPLEPYNQWFWQRNTGSGFEDALIWEGVDTNFHSDPKIGGSLSWYFNVDNFREVGGFLEKIEAVILGTPPPPWETGCNINLSDMNDPCTKTWLANQSATQEIANILAQYGISREPYRTPSEQVYDLSPWSTNNKFFQRLESGFESLTGTISDLMDMNGDGLVDRVLLKNAVLNDLNSAMNWYVQFNNGQGFDPPVLWDEDVRILGNSPNNAIGSSLTVFSGWQSTKNLLVDLHDVTGDGLPDRITLDTNDRQNQPQATWWVEVNNGHTFEPAVAWTGIYGSNILETSIRQDSENFKTWDYWNQSTMFGKQVVDLRDINSDKIPDRLIFREGESRWLVQYGTGSGFLPVQEMKIESLSASTDQIRSSRYDYLHVSLKSESQISQSEGQVRIMLGDPSDPTSYQEWAVTDLGTNWKDFYLPMDSTKLNASEVKVRFEPSVAGATVPIYIDNVTFVATRPPDAKGWLDYLLTEENVLAEVYSDRNQTLAQYLGFSQADEAVSLNWDELLKAETHIAFNVQGEATDFTTSYGSVSRIENGRVVETTLPDGTRVAFSEPTPTNPQSFTQTITDSTGGVQTLNLSYGRVREVLRTGKSPLQYSYEFNTQGEEITVVFDPDSGITERYSEAAPAGGLENRLISRTQANGVETIFEYDSKGELIRSSVIYKGRVREIFEYYTSEAGNRILKTSEGVEEEYTSDGTILFHTTPEGYRYAHSFEQERDVVTQIQTETVLLPDGSSFSVDIPIVNLVDNPAGDEIHRVTLASFKAETGEYAEYESGELKRLKLSDGTRIHFDRMETKEVVDPETGETRVEINLLDALIFHPDGTITEFKDGLPYSVTSATGRVISINTEAGLLINPSEAAVFHLAQAQKLWNEFVKPKWDAFQAPPTLPVQMEYSVAAPEGGDMGGKLVTREFREGVVEIYEEGKINQVLSPDGERLVQYTYDLDGNPTAIQMEGARRRLESAVIKLKAQVAIEREEALAMVAEREQVLNQTIEAQYVIARDQLLAIRAQIEAEMSRVASIKVKGKKAKRLVGNAVAQIQASIDQVNGALNQLADERARALEQLSTQVREANTQIETETQNAYGQIELENQKVRKGILQQELSPIVYHWYRKILGRDPSKTEYEAAIASANYDTGTFDLEGLKTNLLTSAELVSRSSEVQTIKNSVEYELLRFLNELSSPDQAASRQAFLVNLGLTESDLVSLTQQEAGAILDWLKSRSLHFGQSAYIALETLLDGAGIAYSRAELATRLILIDILTGTLTPLETDDLVISMYAMRKLAQVYGLQTYSLSISFDALKAMYEEACPPASQDPCSLRLIAHIDGDHFVIVTGINQDDSVSYIDPSAGPEQALDLITVSKEEFLESWLDPKHPDSGFGYVLSPRPPPTSLPSTQYSILSAEQEMSVRGADFVAVAVGIFIAIFSAAVAIVSAAVTAVLTVVAGLISGIGTILASFGQFLGALFSGNLIGAFQGLFSGILTGLGQIGGAFASAFSTLHGALLLGIQGIANSIPFIGPALSTFTATSAFSGALKLGLIGLGIQGSGVLLEKIGVSPKITQTLISGGKIVAGIGLLATGNPLGLSFIGSGAAELLSLHTSLSPTVTNIISIGATALGAFAGGAIDTGSLGGAIAGFKSALPFLSMDLASAGLVGLGDALGLDPRLVMGLNLVTRAAIGAGVNRLMNGSGTVLGWRDDGTPIIVSSPKDLGDFISGSINTAPSAFDFNVEGQPQFIDIRVTDILNDAVNEPGLIDRVFSSFKDAAISGVNFVGNIVGNTFDSVVDIGQEIASSGLGATLEKYATEIFDRQTIESVFKTIGGVSEILNQQAQRISLPTNASANSIKLSETTSLLLDDSQKLIGQVHNGRFELGDFKIGLNGELFLNNGMVVQEFDDGFVMNTDIIEGRVQTVYIKAPEGHEIVRIQGKNGASIIFDETGQVIDGIINILDGTFRFVVESGILTEVFSSIAEASTTVNGQVITIKGVEVPNSLPLEISQAEEIQGQTGWLTTFMNAGRFNVSMADQTIYPNADNIVYATNFFNPITDTPFNVTHALQLGNEQTGLIDPTKGEYFIVYDTEHISVPPPTEVSRIYTGLDGSLPDQTSTGRFQFAINGPVTLGEHLIFAGQNHIFNRIRAWLTLLLN